MQSQLCTLHSIARQCSEYFAPSVPAVKIGITPPLYSKCNYALGICLSLRFRLGEWWPVLISGLPVFKRLPSVTDPSSGITRLRPFPEAISRISLRTHHKSILAHPRIKRKLYFP